MRRMWEGGVAFNRDNPAGRCQYVQCQAKAGCLSAFFLENQRLITTPSTAPATMPLVPALARKPRNRQITNGAATSTSHKPTFHGSSSRRGMNGFACIAVAWASVVGSVGDHTLEHR